MDEHKIFMIDLDGLFPELDEAPKVSGTAVEILERIADEWGLEEEEIDDPEIPLEIIYPSTRAYKAHQILEERLGKPDAYPEPDDLINALIKEGLIRVLNEDEYDEWLDMEEMDTYEASRSELDDEWTDGVWET